MGGIEIIKEENEVVDWRVIAKAITDYAFEGEDNDETMVTVLPTYRLSGEVVYDKKDPENQYILMNEPPKARKFYNNISKTWQKSGVNVTPVVPSLNDDFPFLAFRANQDISTGSELFICYGAMYDRNYEINMSYTCGCGAYDQVAGNLDSKISQRRYEESMKKYGNIPESYLSKKSRDDERIKKYFGI